MNHIPMPNELPQMHYFLESLNTPETISALRMAVILVVTGLTVLYITVVFPSLKASERASDDATVVQQDTSGQPEAAVHLENPVE